MATSTKKKALKDLEFGKGDFVVYPTHGVGKVTGVEDREIAGQKLQLFVVSFEKERMTLRVPVEKVKDSGLRKLSNRKVIDTALKTLKGKVRVKRTMWSRRAQEYEAKINSGDPVAIAEMYQAALERLARELAAVEEVEHEAAVDKLETLLSAA
jgi:CarD family transcriptional regulator